MCSYCNRRLLLALVALWKPLECLRCYECGIDGRNACTLPFEASMTHTKECRPGVAMCFFIREFGIHFQSRGCSLFVARDGCSFVFAPRRHGIVCNCHDKDLCNCSAELSPRCIAVLTFVVFAGTAVVSILFGRHEILQSVF